MARACPACARPNGDRAAKCLYCSEPLEPLLESSTQPASQSDAATQTETQLEIASAPDEDRHLVILIPGAAPNDKAAESLADAAEMSLYEARLSLAATRPRVFRRLEELLARALSEQLSAARIPHYVVSETSVRSLPVSRAQTLTLEAGHLDVGVDGLRLAVPYRDLQLMVRGEIAREHHDEKKLTTTRGASRSLSPGLLLHLYGRDASVAIEIDPEGFAWPELGAEPSRSALLNLENLIDAIEERADELTVDRGFDHEPPVFSRTGGEAQDFAQILSSRGAPRGALYDNQDQFRHYARWRYRLERHLRKTS